MIKTIALELREFEDPADPHPDHRRWDRGRALGLPRQELLEEGISFYEFDALFRCNAVDDGTLEQRISEMSDIRSVCAMHRALHDELGLVLFVDNLVSSHLVQTCQILVRKQGKRIFIGHCDTSVKYPPSVMNLNPC